MYQGSETWGGFSTGIWYNGYNVLGELEWVYISGLMGSKSKNQIMNRRVFSRGQENVYLLFYSDMVNPLLKTNRRRDRRVFFFFVVWSALIVDRWWLKVKSLDFPQLKSHLWCSWFCSRMARRVSPAAEGMHWSQTSNCKALWIRLFIICLKYNFFLPEA